MPNERNRIRATSTTDGANDSAVGLLVDLLPVGLLVGEVAAAAGLAAVLLHAGKLIYPSIRQLRCWCSQSPAPVRHGDFV